LQIHNASIAVNAAVAVAPCTWLHHTRAGSASTFARSDACLPATWSSVRSVPSR